MEMYVKALFLSGWGKEWAYSNNKLITKENVVEMAYSQCILDSLFMWRKNKKQFL